MAIKVHSTKDVTVNGVKCVLFGASGSGKTVMSATAPNPIILSAEKGLLSLAGKDIPFIEVTNLDDLDAAYKYCKSSEYDTVVMDSLSEITTVVLQQIKDRMIKESASGKIDARQAYGKIAESVGTMIRKFRDMDGKNVVFIAKEKKNVDEESGAVSYDPYLPGQVLPFDLPYLTDEVLCLQIDRKGNRFVQTYADRKRPCKDRSGKLDENEKPDFTHIFNKIKS